MTEHEDAGKTCSSDTRSPFREAYCLYCEMSASPMFSFGELPDPEEVPAVEDTDRWENIGQWHEADCEWIRTRAHRVGQEGVKS